MQEDATENWKAQIYNLSNEDLDLVVWRYLTFPKFIHMLSYGAIWFCRLKHLQDQLEGVLPKKTKEAMQTSYEPLKETFNTPEYHRQIDDMTERNVRDSRSLETVNCWFIGEKESSQMWEEYVSSNEGVAIRSTVRRVRDNIHLFGEYSFIGKVEYVDHDTHEMSIYEGHQGYRRAFLKDHKKFTHESELRLTTLNIKTPACTNALGKPFSPTDIAGAKMNNHKEAGLHVGANVSELFETVFTAPKAADWFHNLVIQLRDQSQFPWKIRRSEIKL